MSLPQAHKGLHVYLAYVGLGTGHAFPGVYPESGCSCGGAGIWCSWCLYSAFWYSFLKCGQHLTPISVPPWIPGGLSHVSHLSLRSENMVWFGGWATEWPWQPPIGPLPAQWYLSSFIGGSSRRTEYLWWPFPFIQACRVVGWAGSSAYTPHKNRPLISSWEAQYPTSWMVGTSTSGSSLRRPCQQPWWISLSASFCPDSVACTNIPWRKMGDAAPNLPMWVLI